jgi:hypothetical protein
VIWYLIRWLVSLAFRRIGFIDDVDVEVTR